MREEKQLLKGVKVIDLFAGIGGFHYAFSSFGADIIYACEWDKEAAAVYEKNFGIKPTGDITKIEANEIPDHDILCAGFPCQPFSISGNQDGFEDERGTLFFDIARIVKEKKPKILFLENVKNLEQHNEGKTIKTIKNTLNKLGYNVFYQVLDAALYGSAQSRKRIYIVCFRKDLGIKNFSFPMPTLEPVYVEDILENGRKKDLEIDRDDIVFRDTKEKHMNRPLRIGTLGKGGQGERIYSIKAKAITLSAYGGGVGAKTGLYKINDKVRRLTPREAARLQGFPDSFIIHKRKTIAYQQFGNSVVIDVLQQIIEKMLSYEVIKRCL